MGFLSKLLGGSASSEPPARSAPAALAAPDQVRRYFDLLGEIKTLQAAHDYAAMLDRCRESLPLLPALVADCKREYGSFDIQGIPAIELGCRYWAALEDRQSIESIAQVTSSTPELRPWHAHVDQALAEVEIVGSLLAHVTENPGVLQSGLGGILGIPSEQAREIAYVLAALGRLEREKSGRSYSLRVA